MNLFERTSEEGRLPSSCRILQLQPFCSSCLLVQGSSEGDRGCWLALAGGKRGTWCDAASASESPASAVVTWSLDACTTASPGSVAAETTDEHVTTGAEITGGWLGWIPDLLSTQNCPGFCVPAAPMTPSQSLLV